MESRFDGYFENHYGSSFTSRDITRYQRSFYGQWRFIADMVEVPTHGNLFEVGAGLGGLRGFLPATATYRGIEVDPRAASFCNEQNGDAAVSTTPLEDISGSHDQDVVFAFEVLEHLRNPSLAIAKVAELLRPGGVFCGTSPYPYAKNVFADPTHVSVLHPVNWQRLFTEAGFASVSVYPLTIPPVLWRINKRLNFRLPFYSGLPGVLSTCLIVARQTDVPASDGNKVRVDQEGIEDGDRPLSAPAEIAT